ncbi:hypothetical protein PVAND_008563 [Polypedilum vanderplanki]|uniref:RRM domain-containing protein n=1 Tax=Polypedilum vanderplanki TaxID=319348 RepID=A0A9J6CAM7_POLVA|nr:hypothetical protein PVAND_008563 [Polypedilum vanderplanki]
MNIIIRLQNLPWSANASDIRQFFKGLHIPEGGVHIVGGENGDAFIAFSTDEDARQAMSMTGSKLKEVQVSLMLSSRAEMQKVIEKARMMSMQTAQKTTQSLPSVEAFTNQFGRKLPDNANMISAQQQQLAALANYKPQQQQQQSALLSTQLLNFQMKPNDLISGLQANIAAPTNLVAGQMPLYNYNQLNSAEYLNYMKMANAANNIQLDNKQLQLQQNSYIRNGTSDSSRDRSRSPLSSRYDSSDDKKEKRRRTRFSSPESNKQTAAPVMNNLMQNKPAMLIQQQQQQAVISTNMLANTNVPKLNNNIWDVPPPMNLNAYSSFNNGVLNNITAAANLVQARNYQTTSDNKSFLPSVQQYQSSQGNSVPAINNNDVGRCIKVTNVDKETTYSDMRKFFNGLPIDDIKFLTDSKGNHNGIVLIKFISSDSKKQSMIKNGWQLKSTLIMITSITDEEYENGLDSKSRDSYKGRDDCKGYNNKYRDRSNSREREYSRERERGSSTDRFNRNRPQNNNRNFNNRDYGNSNNPRFNNRREFHRDNNSASRDNGFRYKNRQDNEQEEKIEYVPDENYRVLVIDDIPEKNEEDLFAAFPNIISVVIDKYMAYVKFTTHEAAKAVLENRFIHYIRNKRVFIEKGSDMQFADYAKKFGKLDNPEMKDHIEEETINENSNESQEQQPSVSDNSNDGQTKPISRDPRQRTIQQQNGNNTNGNSNNMMSNLRTDCVLVKNLEIECSIEDVENFFSEIQRTNMRTHILLDKNRKQCGDCFIEFKFEHDMKKALDKNNTMMGKNKIQVMPIPREQVEAVLSSFGDDNGQFRNQNRPMNRDWAPPLDFGSPGCVVLISNLCYRATIDDIIDAFRDYDLHPDQIIRRYNDFGQPTGNACINFNSPNDAEKACDSLNKVRILNRPVWLRRCNL